MVVSTECSHMHIAAFNFKVSVDTTEVLTSSAEMVQINAVNEKIKQTPQNGNLILKWSFLADLIKYIRKIYLFLQHFN